MPNSFAVDVEYYGCEVAGEDGGPHFGHRCCVALLVMLGARIRVTAFASTDADEMMLLRPRRWRNAAVASRLFGTRHASSRGGDEANDGTSPSSKLRRMISTDACVHLNLHGRKRASESRKTLNLRGRTGASGRPGGSLGAARRRAWSQGRAPATPGEASRNVTTAFHRAPRNGPRDKGGRLGSRSTPTGYRQRFLADLAA